MPFPDEDYDYPIRPPSPDIRITLEMHGRPAQQFIINLGYEWQEAVRPLPYRREFIPAEAARAYEQQEQRENLIRGLAPHITAKLAALIQANDTQNGYPKPRKPQLP